MRYFLLTIITLIFSGCFNKNGISLKYYSECDEYYDMQGYYHNKCGKDDLISYEELGKKSKDGATYIWQKSKDGSSYVLQKGKEGYSYLMSSSQEDSCE